MQHLFFVQKSGGEISTADSMLLLATVNALDEEYSYAVLNYMSVLGYGFSFTAMFGHFGKL